MIWTCFGDRMQIRYQAIATDSLEHASWLMIIGASFTT